MHITRLIFATVLLACALLYGQQESGIGDKGNQAPSNAKGVSPAPRSGQTSGNSTDTNSTNNAEQNKNNDVNLVSVPKKIPIEPVRDRFDWFVLGCTGILTIVGVIGTCAAIKTLRAINTQAHYMRVHARHLDRLAKAVLLNHQATVDQSELIRGQLEEMRKARETSVNKERARLAVEIVRDTGNYVFLSGNNALEEVTLNIVQYGPTRAFNVEGKGQVLITDSRQSPQEGEMQRFDIPHVIEGNETRGHKAYIAFFAPSQDVLDNIQNEKMFVHLFGVVAYEDVFGKSRTSPFRYVWKVDIRWDGQDVEDGPIVDSFWVPNGPEEDNRAT